MKQFATMLVAVGILLFPLAGPAAAESNSATDSADSSQSNEKIAEKLAKRLKTYKNFQAKFIQVVVDGSGSNVQETRGTIKAKRPGLFFWESESPLAQTIVADGKKVEVYDPDLEQVTIRKMDNQISSTPALLLSGEVSNLADAYTVTTREAKGDAQDFTLEPKNPDSLFVSLRLRFRDGDLTEMRLRDSLDQISILSFRDIEVNGSIPDSAFRMEYPDDVDVIK